MKKILIIAFLISCVGHVLQAQTKKIALRSHAGTNATFTLEVPDEFGLGPEEMYRPHYKRPIYRIATIDGKKVLTETDSFAVCTPLSDSAYEAYLQQSQKEVRQLQKEEERLEKKEAKQEAKKEHKQQAIPKAEKPQKTTATPASSKQAVANYSPYWLGGLLLLPVSFFFVISVKP